MHKHAILIAEDDDLLREALTRHLEYLEVDVFSSPNGRIALDKVPTIPNLRVIISDIEMPEMNGLEFIRELRALGFETKFIFYTGFGSEERLKEAARFGAFDFLNKPEIKDLHETVLRALEDSSSDDDLADLLKEI